MTALDATGGGAVTASSTNIPVDITAAVTGADVFVWVAWGLQSATFTTAGWTQVLVGGPASTITCGLFYRRKIAGDTTFTFTAGSAKGSHAWVSYTGTDATTPYQTATLAANFLAKAAASVNVATPAVTNSDAAAWAIGFFASRTSTSGNKVITFTPDAALTERKDQNNSAAASGIWTGVELADSNGAVTAASHSYTAVASFSETFGGGALLYLNPAAAGGTTVTATAIAAVASVPSPTVQAGAIVAPSAVAAVASVSSPTIRAGAVPIPAAIVALAAVPAPTIALSVAITAAAIVAVAGVGAPTPQAGTTAQPGAVVAVAGVPAPVVQAGGSLVQAVTVAATASVGAVSVQAGARPAPGAVAAVAMVPAPTVTVGGGATVTPGAVAATAAVLTPVLAAGSLVTPTSVTAVATVPSPVVQTGARPAPGAVAAVAAVPAPTVQISRVVTPSPVVAVAAIPMPGLSSLLRPVAVAAVTAVPAPTVTAVSAGAYTPVSEPLRARSRPDGASAVTRPGAGRVAGRSVIIEAYGNSRVIPRATATTRET